MEDRKRSIQISCSLKKIKEKDREKEKKRKTRNKLCTRLKPLACVFVCAGYNREASKEAADILLRYVQGDANQRWPNCTLRFISNAIYLRKVSLCDLIRVYLVSEIRASRKKDDLSWYLPQLRRKIRARARIIWYVLYKNELQKYNCCAVDYVSFEIGERQN